MHPTKRQSILLGLLISCIATTAVHYTDNIISIDKYPQAAAVSATTVALTWLLLTPAAFLGYRLYTSGAMLPAYGVLAVYSLVGLSTPGHYVEASLADFALWRNVSIISDGIAGAAVLGFVAWSLLVAKEWKQPTALAGSGGRGPTRTPA